MTDSPVWMAFYGDDFLGSTPTLTGAESFAHLAWIWQGFKREGRLPNDDRKLRMWARCDRRHWPSLKANVIADGHWHLSECGTFFTHGRLTAEVQKAEKARERARLNGAQSKGRPPKQPELDLNGEAIDARRYTHGDIGRAIARKKPNEINGSDNRVGLAPKGPEKPTHNPTHSSQPIIPPGLPAGASPPGGGPRSRGHPLPNDWVPKPSHFELAASKGLTAEWVNDEAALMRARADANGRKRKTNWDSEFERQLRERLTTRLAAQLDPRRQRGGMGRLARRARAELEAEQAQKGKHHDHGIEHTERPPGPGPGAIGLPPLDLEPGGDEPAGLPAQQDRPADGHEGLDDQPRRRAHGRRS